MDFGAIGVLIGLVITQFENIRKIAWLEKLIGGWSKWKIVVAIIILGQVFGMKTFWLNLYATLPPLVQQMALVFAATLVAIGMIGTLNRSISKAASGNGVIK